MATTGGARTGAGRPKKGEKRPPKKVLVPVTQTKLHVRATIDQSTKQRLTERLIDKVVGMKVTPLEVMLNTMKLHYDSAQDALLARDVAEDRDVRESMLRHAKAEMNASSQVAEKVAPYLHPKLQSVVLKGDDQHPLNITGSLRGLSDKELLTMEELLKKAASE
jgi:hypothetical protein